MQNNLMGFVLLPRFGGILSKTPSKCEISGVVDYNIENYVEPNDKCTSSVADILFESASESELETLYEKIIDWYKQEFIWSI